MEEHRYVYWNERMLNRRIVSAHDTLSARRTRGVIPPFFGASAAFVHAHEVASSTPATDKSDI